MIVTLRKCIKMLLMKWMVKLNPRNGTMELKMILRKKWTPGKLKKRNKIKYEKNNGKKKMKKTKRMHKR